MQDVETREYEVVCEDCHELSYVDEDPGDEPFTCPRCWDIFTGHEYDSHREDRERGGDR